MNFWLMVRSNKYITKSYSRTPEISLVRRSRRKVCLTLHAFELATPGDCPPPPYDTDVVTTPCSVGPYAIPSVTILKIGGNRRPS